MNYEETLSYIHNTPKFSRELGNKMLKKLLSHLGNPQERLRFIHIAGTNGKGSVASMLAEIFRCGGYCTGLFTSPYIERFNERIRVNGIEISDEALAETVTRVRHAIETFQAPVSEFALDTAVAFLYFEQCGCDLVVLETGLGGRLDATNVIDKSLVTILTAIGMDHMQYLGDSLEEITREKCGIIKPGCPVVVSPGQPEIVRQVIGKCAEELGSEVYFSSPATPISGGFLFKAMYYRLGLSGEFQAENAAVVMNALPLLARQGFVVLENEVRQGLLQVKHSARFERFGERVILDGGHNAQGAKALCQSLKALHKPIYLCMAMMEDKDYSACVKILSEVASSVVTTRVDMPRCCPAEKLAQEFSSHGILVTVMPEPEMALKTSLDLAKEDGIVCICGSLFLAGQLRPLLRKAFPENREDIY